MIILEVYGIYPVMFYRKKIIQLTSARQVQLADTFWDRLDAILTIEHAMVNAAPDTQRPLFAQSGP